MEFVVSYPPLSHRDISPSRGEIGRQALASLTLIKGRRGKRLISPLEGEMSRSDRGGYSSPRAWTGTI